MLEEFHPFALSLILGLIIGAEREYHHKKSATAFGVRTFPFVALTGTLAAYLRNPYLTAAAAAVVFTLIALSYLRTTERRKNDDPGLTTEFAAVIIFCVGYLMPENARLATLIGMATLALLVSREWLHRFIRIHLRQSEINAAAMLLIAVFGVAPFLPDQTVDPWRLLNPRRLVTLLSLIGLIHFAGYTAIRIFGAKAGLALTGFLGGFISSTAVFLKLRQTLCENSGHQKTVIASGLLAIAAMIMELTAVLAIASPPLVFSLWPALLAIVAPSLLVSLVLVWRDSTKARGALAADPLNFTAVLKLGLLLSLLLALVEIGHRFFASAGLWAVVFTSGLFEMHGASLAVAAEHTKGALDTTQAATAILLAIAASFVSKIAILIAGGRDGFALRLCGLLLILAGAASATLLLR